MSLDHHHKLLFTSYSAGLPPCNCNNIVKSKENNPQKDEEEGTTQQPKPYILSETGGTKRKFAESQNQNIMQHQRPFSSDPFNEVEPKAKRRYEERMSSKLGRIQLEDELGFTTEQMEENKQKFGHKQKNGPLIEEITDWDDEILDDDEGFAQGTSAPIIEEPETNSSDLEEKLSPSFLDVDQSDLISGTSTVDDQQRIVLTAELRDLISNINQQQNSRLQQIGRTIRTGKELIPYIPISPVNLTTQAEEGTENELITANEMNAETPQIQFDELCPATPFDLLDELSSEDYSTEPAIKRTHTSDEESAMEID